MSTMDAYCQLPRQRTQQEKKPELVTFAVKYTNPIDTASTKGNGIQKPQHQMSSASSSEIQRHTKKE